MQINGDDGRDVASKEGIPVNPPLDVPSDRLGTGRILKESIQLVRDRWAFIRTKALS